MVVVADSPQLFNSAQSLDVTLRSFNDVYQGFFEYSASIGCSGIMLAQGRRSLRWGQGHKEVKTTPIEDAAHDEVSHIVILLKDKTFQILSPYPDSNALSHNPRIFMAGERGVMNLVHLAKCFLVLAFLGALLLLIMPAEAQLTDLTQTPNSANAGIHKSLAEEIGAGPGDVMTPDSSIFIIQRDRSAPFAGGVSCSSASSPRHRGSVLARAMVQETSRQTLRLEPAWWTVVQGAMAGRGAQPMREETCSRGRIVGTHLICSG